MKGVKRDRGDSRWSSRVFFSFCGHARKLDRGVSLAPEITVTFENVADMLRVLSAERVRLLRAARQRATPISDLASG